MKRKYVIGALLALMLFVGVASTYALVWYRLATVNNGFVSYGYTRCYNLPTYYLPQSHRIRLIPLNNNLDLYVYGRYSGYWYLLGYGRNAGLLREQVFVTRATRSYYTTLRACAYAYGGSSYFN